MKKIIFLISSALLFASCKQATTNAKPLVVCTTNIITDAISSIADSSFEVKGMMGAGVDPHSYQMTIQDRKLLEQADVIVANGLHLEGKLTETLELLAKQKPVLFIGDFSNTKQLRKTADFQGVYDPHIWFHPQIWTSSLKLCLDSLNKHIAIDFKKYDKYEEDLLFVSEVWRAKFASSMDSSQVLITSHDAFWYFGSFFNVEVKALQGISTVTEAGTKDVVDLVNFIVSRKVKSVFFENSVPKKRLEAVLDGCKAKGHEVTFGGMLYSDALGTQKENAETLLKVYEHNINTIYNGLH